MSTHTDPMSKPTTFALALTAGAGLILMILALGFGDVQGASASGTVIGLTFAAGLALLILGISGWYVVVQPNKHFDDINVPQYTGHHEEHHAQGPDLDEEHAEQPVLPHG